MTYDRDVRLSPAKPKRNPAVWIVRALVVIAAAVWVVVLWRSSR